LDALEVLVRRGGDGPLRLALADDVAVVVLEDLPRREHADLLARHPSRSASRHAHALALRRILRHEVRIPRPAAGNLAVRTAQAIAAAGSALGGSMTILAAV